MYSQMGKNVTFYVLCNSVGGDRFPNEEANGSDLVSIIFVSSLVLSEISEGRWVKCFHKFPKAILNYTCSKFWESYNKGGVRRLFLNY
jgi:hypothetical protein